MGSRRRGANLGGRTAMSCVTSRTRQTPFQLLVHLVMTPQSSGTFSWQQSPDQMTRLAEDLRWMILRRVFTDLNGCSPYKALLQKHAIRVDSLDTAFFREILDIAREKHVKNFNLSHARQLTDLQILQEYFLPLILDWAESERSTSVARERTPSIEDLIFHEDSSGNVYQRFPDEFAWAISRLSPNIEPEAPREIPEELRQFARRIASELTKALKKVLDSGKYEKYILLMSRLEDGACTWEMTFDYLQSFGIKRYSNWKSLSVVANRALREFVETLPDDVSEALHQNDESISREEKFNRLRNAVSASLELEPLPSPREVVSMVA
jgi:hypothetical protein